MSTGQPKWFTRLQVQVALAITGVASIIVGAVIWLADKFSSKKRKAGG
jgi:hypothetical protein